MSIWDDITKAADDSPYAFLTPQTASLAVAGIVSFIVSSLICDGTLPGM